MNEKPKCKLVGANANVFNLIGIASRVLKHAKMHDEAKEMQKKCFACHNYDEALIIIMEYVDVY